MKPLLPYKAFSFSIFPAPNISRLGAAILLSSISYFSSAQAPVPTSYSYTTDAAVQTFTPPAGVTRVTVEAWGGGGAGGGVTNNNNITGGGGAGGNYIKVTNVVVSPGVGSSLTVGRGGNGVSASNGQNGQSSTFGAPVVVTALGGNGGVAGTSGTALGAGGAAIATAHTFYGGAGGTATAGNSGGGGGAAGTGANGANGTSGATSGGAGGAAGGGTTAGGDGATGLIASNPGTAATGLAGGGGGARNGGAGSARSGGAGAQGLIIVTYVKPTKPGIPVLEPADDTGSSNSDAITKNTSVTITGTCDNNASIVIQLYDNGVLIGGATDDGTGGAWSIPLTGLADGVHPITARATLNGNFDTSDPLSLTVDTAPLTSVTISNAGGQSNPEYADNTADFTVVFNAAIDPSTFAASDFVTTGTATYTIGAPTTSNNITFQITATTNSTGGTVIPTLNLNTISDIAGNISASTANLGSPSVTVAATQPTTAGTINFANHTAGSVDVTHAAGDGPHYLVVSIPGAGPVTFTPTDGTAYSAGTQGANQVHGVVASASFPFSISGLAAGQHAFALYAFSGNGVLPNYLTTAATGTTNIISGTEVTLSAGSGTELAVQTFTTASPGTFVFDFKVTDGSDGHPAKISQIIIKEGSGDDFSDWQDVLLGAELNDGGTPIAAADITANTIEFTLDPATIGLISSGTNKTYTLKVWLNPSLPVPYPTTIDGLSLSFLVDNSSFTFQTSGSGLAASQSASSGSTNNEIDILATQLVFTQEPPATAFAAVPFAAASQPRLEARDANGNLDLDDINADVITADPDELLDAGAPSKFQSGVMDFATASTFRYDAVGTSTLTVSTATPLLDVTSSVSTVVTASTAVAEVTAGLLSVATKLQSATNNNGILGFSLTTDGAALNFTDLIVTANHSVTGKLTNIHLLRSPSSSFTLVGATVLRTVSAPTGTTITFASFSTAINATPSYYYIMADVETDIFGASSLELTLDPTIANVVTKVGSNQTGSITGTTFAGDDYPFADVTPPSLVSITNSASLIRLGVGNDAQIVTVVFSEPMDGSFAPNISIDGTFGAGSIAGGLGWTSSTTYSIKFTHTGAAQEVNPANSHITAGGAKDAAGNVFAGSQNSLGFTIDTQAPTPVVTRSNALVTHTVPTQLVTVTYAETVTGVKPSIEFWRGGSDLTSSFTSNGDGAWSAVPHKIWTETFTYIVDEVVVSGVVARVVAGAPIADVAGNAGLVGNSTTFTIDTDEPQLTDVVPYNGPGSYTAGFVFQGEMYFDDIIVVTGNPTFTMTGGGTATITPFPGNSLLVWTYTVGAGQNTSDLEVQSINMSVGNTIRDGAGNDLNLNVIIANDIAAYWGGNPLIVDTTLPTVTSVTSSTANGYYNAGDAISIQVVFNEPVNLFVVPTLGLNTGALANYVSGNGTNTLNFSYVVVAGQNSADLDYGAITSLTGDIRDYAGNASPRTLPVPGAANSLGNNKDIHIDTATPTVTSVNSSTANGYYNAGDVISIQVNFSEPVDVTGFPVLALNSSGSATYVSGTGTSALNFSYTVASGHNSADLNYVTSTSLTLPGGATIEDLADNTASLTLPAPTGAGSLGTNKDIHIDTILPTVNSVNSSTGNGYYNAGDVISIQVNFSEPVDVTGTPTLALNSGGSASYASGTGTSTLTFNYTVAAGHNSADLDYSATTSLALAGGTIEDLADNTATLTLPAPAAVNSLGFNKDIHIDTTLPTVTSVNSSTGDGYYNAGDIISIQVNFSEPVDVTGIPALALNSTASATYASGTGTSTLNFSYTVGASQNSVDLNYVATTSLTLPGGATIEDLADNTAALTLPGLAAAGSLGTNRNIHIDTTVPTVSSINSSTANGYYNAGDIISIQVNFSEPVDVTGTPALALNSTGSATYVSGTGTSTLDFSYTVAAGQNSVDLNYVATTSLTLPGGATIEDLADNSATLTLPGLAAAGSLGTNKDIHIDTVLPTVSSVNSSTLNGFYNAGDIISIQVNFSEAVDVTGTPVLALNSGGSATYASGTGTSILTFSYTVLALENSVDLDYSAITSLTLPGGATIEDFANNTATLNLPAPAGAGSLGNNKNIHIDTIFPTVTSVNSSTANGYYKAGGVISIQVNFSESVDVTGTPTLALNSGGTATFASGTGTSTLTFSYTVLATQNSVDLDYLASTSLVLAGGTIEDLADNTASLTLPAPAAAGSLGSNKDIHIDTTKPTVTSISSVTADGYYNAGDVISIQINFSEPVDVTGTPTLTLNSGGTATYASGTGTSTLNFNYTVLATQNNVDLNYSATSSLALAGGTINDFATNTATLTLPALVSPNSLGGSKDIHIDTVVPTVASVSSATADGFYNAGDVISIQIVFSEPVDVTGTPVLALNSGGTAFYSSGTGTNTLTFTYTVAVGQNSSDLDYSATTSLTLAGGVIEDYADNAATRTLATPGAANSISDNQAIHIDTVIPTVLSVSSTAANGFYNAAEVITINIVFSEPVAVFPGAKTLDLNSGGTATYTSGTGTNTLTFTYTVLAGENSDDLDYVNNSSLNGDIRDLADNSVNLTLPTPNGTNSISDNQAIDIDTIDPTVVSVSSTTADGFYNAPDVITIQVLFSEQVAVVGTPTLTLNSGGTASYSSGSGTNTLTFLYTILATQNSNDLDYSATTSLAGNIRDFADNIADLTLATPNAVNSISNNKAIHVDTVLPTVLSVASTTTDGFYNAGEAISIQVVFSEQVNVNSGTPTLALNSTGSATYVNGSGTNTLNFLYTVLAGENNDDLDYTNTSALSGDIRDFADNGATLTLASPNALNSISDNKAIDIDTQPETVLFVSSTKANGYYKAGTSITIQVKFSEPVLVHSGTPTLDLISSGTAVATYAGGSGTDTFNFTYIVLAGENTDDLDYAATTSLHGDIRDFADNSAILTLATPGALNSISDNQAIDIDTILPVMVLGTGNTITNGLLNGIGTSQGTTATTVTFNITFSEPVTGVDPSDFLLTAYDYNGNAPYGNAAYPAITAAIPVGGIAPGPGPTDVSYVVTVNIGSGTGRLRLDLDATGTILDYALNDNIVDYITGKDYGIVRPQPSNHPTGLSAGITTPSSVDLSWTNSIAGVTPTHLLITAVGPEAGTELVNPTPFAPVDGNVYPYDDDFSDGEGLLIVDLVNDPTPNTTTFINLRSGKQYKFTIYPYSLTPNNSNDNANYLTAGNVFTTATTQTSAVGTLTSINTGVPATISSLSNTYTPEANFSFEVTDDGLTPASDDAKMFINQIIIKADAGNTVPDWSEVIAAAELRDVKDNAGLGIIATAITANTIKFDLTAHTGINGPGEVEDNETKRYELRVRLKNSFGGDAPHNVDGLRFEFLVFPDLTAVSTSCFTYLPNSSRILDTEFATSDHLNQDLNNRVNVIATRFDYTTQPPGTIMVLKDVINAVVHPDDMIPGFSTNDRPVVRARDINGNTDRDYAATVQITNASTIPMLPGNATTLNVNMASGIAPFPSGFQYADDGDGQLTIHSSVPNENSIAIPDQQSSAITVNYSTNTEINLDTQTEADVISSLKTTAADAMMVFDFTVKDIDLGAVSDGAPTRITQIKITEGLGDEIDDWSQAIEDAYLVFDGVTSLTKTSITANEILFDAFPFNTAGDFGYVPAGSSRNYQLFIHLRPDLGGTLKDDIDNKHFHFKVDATDVLLNTLSSSFANGETTHSNTDGEQNNRVEVITTALVFITEPPALAFVNTDLTIHPVVEAQDARGNRDIDYGPGGSALIITNGGSLPMDDAPTAFANGVLAFPTIFQYAHVGFGAKKGIGGLTVHTTTLPINSATLPADAVSNPVLVRVATSTTINVVSSATPATISSLIDTNPEATKVFQFEIEDDGGAENDGNPTQIQTLTIQAGSGDEILLNAAYDWTHAIAGAKLDDGNGHVVVITAPSPFITPSSLSFDLTGATGFIADGTTETFTLKVWLRNDIPSILANEIDGLHLEFAVSVADVVIDDTNSEFIPGESANSGAGNVVDVTATQLDITSPVPPPTVTASLNTPFPVTVQARDVNQNRDLDFSGPASAITDLSNASNDVMFSTPSVEASEFTSGVFVFPADFQFTSGNDQDDVTLTMTAGSISTIAPPAPFTPEIRLNSSFESVLIKDPGFVPTTDIRYIDFQNIATAATSVALAQFKLFDGGDTDPDGDPDGASTNIEDITFSITHPANISSLAIYVGNTLILSKDNTPTNFVTVGGVTKVTFEDLSPNLVAPDGGTRSIVFTVRASFYQTPAAIHDNDDLVLHVTSVTQNGGSKFNKAVPNPIGGITNGAISDPVLVEVMATILDFTIQPPAFAPIDRTVSIDPVVMALDINGVVDLDVTGANGSVVIISGDGGPKLDANISNPPASFVNGVLNFPSLRYTSPGDGTITAKIINGDLTEVVGVSNLVDVLHVTALKATKNLAGSGDDTYILRGGDKAQALFGVTFQAPYVSGAEPKIEDFSIQFITGASNIPSLFSNMEVYRSDDNVWDGAVAETNITNEGGGKARATQENKTLHITYLPSTDPDVAIPVPQELFPTDNSPAPDTYEVTYFIVADISTTVSAATPPVQLVIKDLGFGNPATDVNITTSEGSVFADLQGTVFSFASVNAPVITASYPATGQLDVSTAQKTVNVKFSVPVSVVGKRSFLLVQKNNPAVRDSLHVLNYVPGTKIDTVQFGISNSFLKPNTSYYITAGSDVIEDSDGKPMLAITYPDLFYFRTADPTTAPALLASPRPTVTQRSQTGATITANFNNRGKAYFLVLPNNSVKPTDYLQITGEHTHPDKVFNGQIDIQQTNSISSYGLITAPLDKDTEYDVWIYAEGYEMVSNDSVWFESVPTPVSNSAAFGGNPSYSVTSTTPTLEIPVMTPAQTDIQVFAPSFALCSNSYQPQNLPITIVEKTVTDFDTNGIERSFNLLLPTGYQFDNSAVDGVPNYGKVILTGGDFVAGSGSLTYLNNSIVTIKFKTNSGTGTTRDNISIVGLRFIAASQADPGNLTRLGGQAIPSFGDGYVFASVSTDDASTIGFTNSYSVNVFNDPTPPVSIIPDNYGEVELIPLPGATDFGPSAFSGTGVTINKLNLSAVPLDIPFQITITHTDNNGCISQNAVQYTKYNHNTAIVDLSTQDCLDNTNFFSTAPPYVKYISAVADSAKQNYLRKLKATIPYLPGVAKPLMNSGDQRWLDLIEGRDLVNGPFLERDGDSTEIDPSTPKKMQDYKYDVAKLLNANFMRAYDSLEEKTPNGQSYWISQMLGVIEYTATYVNLSNRQLDFPKKQNVEYWLKAKPAIDVNGTGKKDSVGNAVIFCQDNGIISIAGYPDAAPGPFHGYFTLFDNSISSSDSLDHVATLGFTDFGNGSAQIDPTKLFNSYKEIRIRYTYKLDGSPCGSNASIIIKITPNPVAKYVVPTIPCVDADITFDGSVSDFHGALGFKVTNWLWDFDDPNATGTGSGANGPDSTREHKYSTSRIYTPTLKVTSEFGCLSTILDTQTLAVGGIPKADFRFDGVSVADTIVFTDQSAETSHPQVGDRIDQLNWSYGGAGAISPIRSAIKYATPGSKIATLTSTSLIGCVSTKTDTLIVLHSRQITNTAYEEEFTGTDGLWQVASYDPSLSAVPPSWTHLDPLVDDNTRKIKLEGNNGIWITDNGTGAYNGKEKSAIYSPALDMSDVNLTRPMIALKTSRNLASGDGVVLEYSTDNFNVADPNKAWKVLIGKSGVANGQSTGDQWFNASGLGSQPGGKQTRGIGWDGTSDWVDSKHILDTLLAESSANRKHVVFRLALGSVSGNPDAEGFAFDNVRIGNRTRTVLVENFTNLGNNSVKIDGHDAETQVREMIRKFGQNDKGTRLVRLNYHVGFPKPDPFNLDNPQDANARALFYGIRETPRTRLDGKGPTLDGDLFTNWGERAYNINTLKLAEAKLTPHVVEVPGGLSITVDIEGIINGKAIPKGTILHVAIVEDSINYDNLPDAKQKMVKTEDRIFSYVVKKMVPSAVGTRLPNDINYQDTYTTPALIWEAPDTQRLYASSDSVTVVVFLQDETTGYVYQSESISLHDPGVITGLEDGLRIEDVVVHPNPSNQEMNILLPRRAMGDVRINLVDQMGKYVMDDKIRDGEREKALNVQELASGIYILQLQENGRTTFKKVMVVH
jgi:hypothetical protein